LIDLKYTPAVFFAGVIFLKIFSKKVKKVLDKGESM